MTKQVRCLLRVLVLLLLSLPTIGSNAVLANAGHLEPSTEPIPIQTNVTVAIIDYRTHWGLPGIWPNPADTNMSLGPYTPLLGNYQSDDPTVMDWHIKWALEHGITLFIIDSTSNWIASTLLKSRYINRIKFAFDMYVVPEYWGYNKAQIQRDFDSELQRLQKYLSHPSYYKIDSRPLVLWGEFSWACCTEGHWDPEFLRALLEDVRTAFGNPFLMASEAWQLSPEFANENWQLSDWASKFDGLYNTNYNGKLFWNNVRHPGNPCLTELYSALVQDEMRSLPDLSAFAHRLGERFVPTVMPGRNEEDLFLKGFYSACQKLTNPTPDLFKSWLAAALPYVDKSLKLIFVNSWNEFNEGHAIEPTKQYGFSYLDAIREVFSMSRSSAWPSNIAPTRMGYYVEYRPDGSTLTNIPINSAWQFLNQVLRNFTNVPVFLNPQARNLSASANEKLNAAFSKFLNNDYDEATKLAKDALQTMNAAYAAERQPSTSNSSMRNITPQSQSLNLNLVIVVSLAAFAVAVVVLLKARRKSR